MSSYSSPGIGGRSAAGDRLGFKLGSEFLHGGGKLYAFVARRGNHAQSIHGYEAAQVGFALVSEALPGPLHAETKIATAIAAAGDDDAIDAAA